METEPNNTSPEDRPSKTELLGASKQQIERQGKSVDNSTDMTNRYKEGGRLYQTFIGTVSIIFIVLGIIALGVWGWIAIHSSNQPTPQNIITPTSLIPVSAEREIVVSESTSIEQKINRVNEMVSLSPDSFLQIYFTTQENDEKRLLSSEEFVLRLQPNKPFPLDLYLKDEFMYGSYITAEGEPVPYLIFTVTDYSQAYGTMLEIENTLSGHLQPLGFPSVEDFADTIVQNQDIRFAAEESGGSGIYYAFPGQNELVITTTRPALESLFQRLR